MVETRRRTRDRLQGRRRIDVIIPAHDEADRIGATVAGARAAGVDRIIVVDDGSTDATADLAAAAGAEVLRLDRCVGKGGALARGIASSGGEIMVLLDGDIGESACEIAKLIAPVARGEADMSVARFPQGGGGGGFGLVKGLARWGIRRFGGIEAQSPLSGQRALSREAWRRIGGFAFGYGAEVALTIKAARAGLRIVEVPVAMRHRAYGKDLAGFLHRGKQLRHVAYALWRVWREGGR